jgi:hypothetical protein
MAGESFYHERHPHRIQYKIKLHVQYLHIACRTHLDWLFEPCLGFYLEDKRKMPIFAV